ncbi:hypothetical protein ACIXHP_06990 [Bacteroides fragilis]
MTISKEPIQQKEVCSHPKSPSNLWQAKASRGFSSISETVIDIWVRVIRLCRPRNTIGAGTLSVIR